MKIAFLFSGQGSQFPGMFAELSENYASAKEIFDMADKQLERPVSTMCFGGTQEALNLTHNTQPCVLATDLAAAAVLMEKGVKPEATAGFSLGEYAALVTAGVMKKEDIFKVIQVRADVMQEAVPTGEGAMAAIIGKSSEEVEALCTQVTDGYVIAANYNSPVQTVVSGTAAAVDKLVEEAEKSGIRAVKLAVSAPFHCALMQPAADKLALTLEKCSFSEPEMPVYMNYTAQPLESAASAKELLYRQVFNPVLWAQTLENLYKDGFDTFIECGPGKTLSGLVKKTLKGVSVYNVEDIKSLEKTMKALQEAALA